MDLKIELTEKQTVAWDYLEDNTTTELGYGGAARGGKTYLCFLYIIYMCVTYPHTRWAVGRRELKNLKRTTLLTFFKAIQALGIDEEEVKYNQDSSQIEFISYGSKILLLDLAHQPSDPLYTWMGGLEITGAWIDESNEVTELAVSTLKTRCGNHLNKEYEIKPLLIETFNPSKGHIYKRYWKPYRDKFMPEYRKFVPALPSDNPYIDPSYIVELGRMEETIKQRLLYGNFDYSDDPLKIFDYRKLQDMRTNTFVQSGDKYISGDIAGKGKDKTVLVVWDGWRVIDIYAEKKTDQSILITTIKELQEKYDVPNSQTILDYDGIGVGIVDNLKCRGFQANTKPHGDKARLIYQNLRSQCWFRLAEIVNEGKLFIFTKNNDIINIIIEEMDVIKEVRDGMDGKKRIIPKGSIAIDQGKETIRGLLGHSPDYGDAIMMRAYFDLKNMIVSKSYIPKDITNTNNSYDQRY